MAAQGLSPLVDDDRAALGEVHHPPIDYQAIDLLFGAQGEEKELRRGRPRTAEDLREAGCADERACRAARRRAAEHCGRRRLRFSVSVATTFKKTLAEKGIIFCSFSEAVRKSSRSRAEIHGFSGSLFRQLFRDSQQRGIYRWQLLLHPQRRAMPDGIEHLFPHQCQEHRTI